MLIPKLILTGPVSAAAFALCCAWAPSVAGSGKPAPLTSPDSRPHPGDEGAAMSHVRAEVALDHTALVPGAGAMIGVRFIIEEGWHLYWRNSGDSGMPISVTFEAPEGVRLGEVRWPAPERHVYGHGSVDYIYEHEVALLASVEVDGRFHAGDRIEITARFELLACREVCVFGSGERTLVIDIDDTGAKTEPGWMKNSRSRIPQRNPLGPRLSWDGTHLLISAYEHGGPGELAFFPTEPSAFQPQNLATDGISETGSLRLAYPLQIFGQPRVAGVVELMGLNGPVWIEIETTPPANGPGGDETNEPTPPPNQSRPINNRSGD
jgi:DsbC/DsbD-like thiol-disulfide interchange protein